MSMRFHVIGLPHTETLSEYNQCAYTAKVRKFATMMHRRGHEVYLYSSGRNEAECTEHIQLLSSEQQQEQFGQYDWWRNAEWFGVEWDPALPYWRSFNSLATEAVSFRIEPHDYICLITGSPHKELVDAFPAHMCVEYGIGYEGVYAPYRIYESYAWMHCLYGKEGPSISDGRFYDAVIPNYFDTSEFPIQTGQKEGYLFLSRMTARKGYEIAIELTERLGEKLIVAGTGGDRPQHDHVEYVGFADAEYRGELLASTKALICPTLYLEPFGGVVAEAMLCGTPVLTTDWGAFTETVRQGVDGFRCRNMAEFEIRAREIEQWSQEHREGIRSNAQARFGIETVAPQYEDYFDRLSTLWGDGFYTTPANTALAPA